VVKAQTSKLKAQNNFQTANLKAVSGGSGASGLAWNLVFSLGFESGTLSFS
jgi:hypothetical protein